MPVENEKARKAASGPDVAGRSSRRILPARPYCANPVALNFSRLPSDISVSFVTLAAFLTALPTITTCVTKETEMSEGDRKSTRLNSSHLVISYAVFCLKKKKKNKNKHS